MSARATAADRRWRNVALDRERDVERHRWMWTLLATCLIAFSPFAVYLLEQMQHVQLRYRVESLRSESRRLVETERRLRVQAASLEAPRAVEARAKDELGLVHPASNQRVVILPAASGRGGLMARGPDSEGGAR
jgi:cell division protein FtsB